ncbi:MAG TPA: peroxidase-related enzyme, partial [Thermoanaerobaculia bacterium]
MSYFSQVDLGGTFEPFLRLREGLGFVPNLFRAQSLLPRVIEAEARIAGSVLLKEGALSRVQKESLLLVISAAHENTYCVTAHARLLATLGLSRDQIDRLAADYRDAGLSPQEKALLGFACKLSGRPTSITRADLDGLRRSGFSDEQILEAVLMTGLTEFLCTLSTGLGSHPDFEPLPIRPARRWQIGGAPAAKEAPVADREHDTSRPYLRTADMNERTFPPFAFFRDRFGFVPNIFRAQTLRPDIVEAEAHVVGTVLLSDDVLSRTRKEYILLVISAANLNTYCVAVHCEMLRALGVATETSDQIAIDHRRAPISEADRVLLDFALKLARRPLEFSGDDIEGLRRHGFSETQVLEAVVMSSLTNFLNTLQMGLGTVPDFPPKLVFTNE